MGDKVAVRLVGSDEWREGRVRQVRGSAARTDDRLFAAQIPSAGPGTITLEVSLPPDDTQNEKANSCGIGRLAEVRIRRPFFGFASGLMPNWFSWDAEHAVGQRRRGQMISTLKPSRSFRF